MNHRRLRAVAIGAAVTLLGVGTYLNRATGSSTTWQATPDNLQQLVGSGSPVQPGDTIVVNPGVYGCIYSAVSGTSTEPVVVQGLPGAMLDGAACTSPDANNGPIVLNIASSDIWFRDMEIGNSNPDKFNPDPGSNPTYRRPNGISITGQRVKVINSFVHDAGDGIGFWGGAADSEVYGTTIVRSGWYSTDRTHGHGIYVQNDTNSKRVTNTFVLDTYNQGVTAYATAGYVRSVYFDGLIAANSGRPAGGVDREANLLIGTEQNPADDVKVTNSVFYQEAGVNGAAIRAGYGVAGNRVSITNSLLVGGSQALDLTGWQQATVTGNTFYATAGANRNASDILAYVSGLAAATWNGNAYHDLTWTKEAFAFNGTTNPANGSQLLPFPVWRTNSGYDGASTYDQSTPADRVIVQPNTYETRRYNLAVLNWSRQATTTVDLGVGSWTAYDASTMTQVAAGSGPVTVPTPDEFGAFIIRTAGTTSTTTTLASTTTTSTTTSSPTTTTVATTTTTHKPRPCRRFLWWCI